MKLWEKNFLITFLVFLIMINSILGFLVISSFRGDMEREYHAARKDIDSIAYFIYNMGDTADAQQISRFSDVYKRNGVTLQIQEVEPAATVQWSAKIINEDESVLSIKNSFSLNGKEYNISYFKNIDSLYAAQKSRVISTIIGSIFGSIMIGWILFLTMRQINKPIDHIAHELRTPLTNIQGYAQYLSLANITDEDKTFAMNQVLNGSKELTDIVERLLASSNLSGGHQEGDDIDLLKFTAEIRREFPDTEIQCHEGNIFGDKILIKSLIRNLIANGQREGRVTVFMTKESLEVKNTGIPVNKKLLSGLNKNKVKLSQIKRNGYGLSLCYDIVKLHKWKLEFTSSKETGTVAKVTIKGDTK